MLSTFIAMEFKGVSIRNLLIPYEECFQMPSSELQRALGLTSPTLAVSLVP